MTTESHPLAGPAPRGPLPEGDVGEDDENEPVPGPASRPRTSPSHAPSQRDEGRVRIELRTPPEGTPIVIKRSSAGRARALAGPAGAALQACELIL